MEGDSYIRSICFTRDNQCLVTGAEDKTVKVWDIATGRIKYTCGGEQGIGVLEQICFGPHARYGFKEVLDPAR